MPTSICQDENERVEHRDRVFTALSAEPRRQVLISLLNASPEEFVELPGAATSPALDCELRELRSRLIHRHLPVLEDYEFVRWEMDPFLVRRGPKFEQVGDVIAVLLDLPETVSVQLVTGYGQLDRDLRTE
ncbi:hypothetical protein [Halostagnicola bangensis]